MRDGTPGVRHEFAANVAYPHPQGVLPEAQVRVFEGVSHVGLLYTPAVLEWILGECREASES